MKRSLLAFWALAGLALWTVYQRTLCPAFPPNDSPETIAAGFGLGIQHPPGYPLHSILGRLAVILWPAGSPAWRVNCLSAGLAVVGCLATAAWIWKVLRPASPGSAAAASCAALVWLGLSRTYWQQATEAKGGIYLLHYVLLALALHAALDLQRAWHARAAGRALTWMALWLGLAMANHYMSMLACLPALAWPLWQARRRGLLKPGWMPLLAAAAGLSVYLEIPLRAAFHPAANLGHAGDWNNFWYLVLRRGYSGEATALSPGVLQAQLSQALDFLANEGSLLMPACAGLGAWWLWRLGRKGEVGMLAALGACILGAVVFFNGSNLDTVWLMKVFLVPALLPLAALGGAGLAWAAGGWRRGPAGWMPVLPALLLGLGLFLPQAAGQDRRTDFFAYDFGKNVLASLPARAVYLPEGDFYFMPLYYVHSVEGRRQDVAALHYNQLTSLPGLLDLKRQQPGLSLQLHAARSLGECLQAANPGLPFATSTYHAALLQADLAGGRLAQRGLVQEIVKPGAPPPPAGLAVALALRLEGPPLSRRDPFVKNLLRWYKESWTSQLTQLAGDDPGLGARIRSQLRGLQARMQE